MGQIFCKFIRESMKKPCFNFLLKLCQRLSMNPIGVTLPIYLIDNVQFLIFVV